MKVYILMAWDYEQRVLWAYSTKEKAEEAGKEYQKEYGNCYDIEEHQLDK